MPHHNKTKKRIHKAQEIKQKVALSHFLLLGCKKKAYLLQAGIVCVPGDDGNPQVIGELKKILSGGRIPAVELRIGKEQNGRHVALQKCFAHQIQNGWNKRKW